MLKQIYIALFCLVSLAGPAATSGTIDLAPDFALKGSSGQNLRLSELRGQVVMINFWASWCGPCRQEMPHLEALYQRYESLGFELLGINVEQDRRQADQMLRDIDVSFPILFDDGNEVSELYNVIAMPSTILIDRDGRIRHIHHGYKSGFEEEYQSQIRSLIRE